MLVFLAAAVRSVNDPAFADISCARSDAYRLYKTLERVCEDAFDPCRSVVLVDPASDDFSGLVASVSRELGPDDQLVVYFSGHAQHKEGMTRLLFANADAKGRGRVRADVLLTPLIDTSVNGIVILDCCNSGNALSVADTRDPLFPRRVTVLAATEAYEPAQYVDSGSAFTTAFCRGLDRLAENNHPLSLADVVEHMRDDPAYEGDPTVNFHSGQSDHVLQTDRPNWNTPDDAEGRFLRRLSGVSTEVREALWYGTREMPTSIRVKLLRDAARAGTLSEPSWLVRRAIGTMAGNLPAYSRASVRDSFLAADRDWMHHAIGIIAARTDVAEDDDVADAVSRFLAPNTNVDLVWLAHLYLSDSRPDRAFELALTSPLMRSPWGIVDLYRRHANRPGVVEEIRDGADSDERLLGPLRTHLRLLGRDDGALQSVTFDDEVVESEIAQRLYAIPPRGRIRHPQSEWLYSYLYGAWRDEVGPLTFESLDRQRKRDAEEAVAVLGRLPAVEIRMAIGHFAANSGDHSQVVDLIRSWALTDVHPWVRRESLTTDTHACAEAFFEEIDRSAYPGALDLALRGLQLGVLPSNLRRLHLTALERDTLSTQQEQDPGTSPAGSMA